MTGPDYPTLGLPSAETAQLAHIATYVADALARHSRAPRGRAGRQPRARALRDLAGAATALSVATDRTVTTSDLPRPLDRRTFTAVQALLTGAGRSADVVALDGIGQRGWAVLGHVPGVGDVGAQVPDHATAQALRAHFLTRPADELAAWATRPTTPRIPTLPLSFDLAAFVEHLDPARDADRAVARWLRGQSHRSDAAIRGRFAGVDLDARPPARRRPRVVAPRRTGGPARAVARLAAPSVTLSPPP